MKRVRLNFVFQLFSFLQNNYNFISFIKNIVMSIIEKQCKIQSKYLKAWQQKSIELDIKRQQLSIVTNKQHKKSFPLNNVQIKVENQQNNSFITLSTNNRVYKIQDNANSEYILHHYKLWRTFKNLKPFTQQNILKPLSINYYTPLRPYSLNMEYVESIIEKRNSLRESKIIKNQKHKRINSYIKADWQKSQKQGGLVFINEDKKSFQTDIIAYVIKRVFSTGSFMGISFPVFAMKPQSMLQTYCKSMTTAPILFDLCITDPIDRMKAFNCFLLNFSLLFLDLDKSFNPTIGETFQCKIGNFQVSCEQTSHHPPISSIFLDGDGFIIHASLELDAKLSINSAIGIFYGDVVIQYDDGCIMKGKIMSGKFSGILYGQQHFGPIGASYSYNPINHLVSSYQVIKKDQIEGYIGQLKQHTYDKFIHKMSQRERFESFKHIPEKQLTKKYCSMKAFWTKSISYDNKIFSDYQIDKFLPYELQRIQKNQLLQSDSSHRYDIKLREQNKINQSQQQKQRIQQIQRQNRKLREKYNKSHKIPLK